MPTKALVAAQFYIDGDALGDLPVSHQTKYAKNGSVHIAYLVMGNGPIDLVYVPGLVSHLDFDLQYAPMKGFLQKLASFARVIIFDKRGTGLSDRGYGPATFEERIEDITAVMDDAGSEKAVVYGESDGATMSLLFAATHPERTLGIVVCGGEAKGAWAPDYPWEITKEEYDSAIKGIGNWGSESSVARTAASLAPTAAQDPDFIRWLAGTFRSGASPSAMIELLKMNAEMDVRGVLPTIHVPSIVIHFTGDLNVRVENGRYVAQHIPGAKYVELPGVNHMFVVDSATTDRVVKEVREFVETLPTVNEPNRVLATLLFMDIVNSTDGVARLGDSKWKETIDQILTRARSELAKYQGREIKVTGDGMLAIFDGSTRAIRCACAIRDSMAESGFEARFGIHAGECILAKGDVQGLAVHIASRVMEKAGGHEVLVSSTVKDLVAGSGISFEDRGLSNLKGVPGKWKLYSVKDD